MDQKEAEFLLVDGNRATAESVTPNPRTLEQLLEACRVDSSVWRVEDYRVNKWEVAAMPRSVRKTGDEKWVRPSGEPMNIPLYQVKARLVRISPEPFKFPVVAPVNFAPVTPLVASPIDPGTIQKALVIPDIQCGFKRDHRTGKMTSFHDRRAMWVAWAVAQKLQPDRIILLGDNLDLPEFSDKFVRSPEFYFTAQASVAELGWWLARLRRSCPNSQVDYIEGNHDARFLLSLINHNAQAYDLRPADDLDGHGLMSVPRLLGLDSLGITYHGPYPTGEVWVNDNFRWHHGHVVRSQSGKTVTKIVEDSRHSEGVGHIHRIEMACKTGWSKKGPKNYMAMSPGTLAKIDPGAVPAFMYRNNWQQGFAVQEFEVGNGYFNIYPVQIHAGASVFEGRRWTAPPEHQIVSQIKYGLGDKVRID